MRLPLESGTGMSDACEMRITVMFIRSTGARLLAGVVLVTVLTQHDALALHAAPVPQLQIVRRPESAPSVAPRPNVSVASGAMTELVEARTDFTKTVALLRQTMLESPDYAEAVEALRVARADHQAATLHVLNIVRATPAYRAQQAVVVSVEQRLEQVRLSGHPSDAELHDAALALATERSRLTNLEAQALNADASVTSAKQRLVDATRALALLQRKLNAALLTDPIYTAAKRRLDGARRATVAGMG